MADTTTRADALGIYLTGAEADGGDQADPDASLGGYRSSERAAAVGIDVQSASAHLRFQRGGGAVVPGAAHVEAVAAGSVAWTPPGGAQGEAVAIAEGETKVLEGGDSPGAFLLVARVGTASLSGTTVLALVNPLNNLFGDLDADDLAAGAAKCRCLCLRNDGDDVLTDIRFWLAALGELAAVDAAGYAASGAVTIAAGGSTSFARWPWPGVAANDATGEALYYSARSDAELTVPAAGRDVWSDVGGGAAGSEGDVLRPISPWRIGLEAPSAQPDGAFTLLADEGDPMPVSPSWPTAFLGTPGVAVLGPGEIWGLWLELTAVQEATPTPLQLGVLAGSFEGEA